MALKLDIEDSFKELSNKEMEAIQKRFIENKKLKNVEVELGIDKTTVQQTSLRALNKIVYFCYNIPKNRY